MDNNPFLSLSMAVRRREEYETLSLGLHEQVFNSDFTYWEVNQKLKLAGMTMTRIDRIHNNVEKKRFEDELELFKKNKQPGFEVNVESLYHGSAAGLAAICNEGLSASSACQGHFGRGFYFSDNPGYCRNFCEPRVSSAVIPGAAASASASEPQQFFVTIFKVILGDCKVYAPGLSDPDLTREPERQRVGSSIVYFDSVKGKPGEYNEYVIYEKRRALVEYVVHYTSKQPLPAILPLPKKKASSARRSARVSPPHTPIPERPGADSSDSEDEASSGERRSRNASGASSSSKSSNGSHDYSIQLSDSLAAMTTQPIKDQNSDSVQSVSVVRRCTLRMATSGATNNPVSSPGSHASANIDQSQRSEASAFQAFAPTFSSSPPPVLQRVPAVGTVGSVTSGAVVDKSSEAVLVESEDAIQQVMDSLASEFLDIAPAADMDEARTYLMAYDMDLNLALANYFSSTAT